MRKVLLLAIFLVGIVFSSAHAYEQGDSLEFYDKLSRVSFVSDSVPVTVYLNGEFYLSAQKHKDIYYSFKEEDEVVNLHGYGIYYDNVCVDVPTVPYEMDPFGEKNITRCGYPKIRFWKLDDHIFNLKYELPLVYEWGNWLSVRREFASVVCLDSASGIQFDLKTVKGHFNCKLRLAVCVVNIQRDFYRHGADKMWWYDNFPVWILCDGEAGWVSLKASFDKFEKSYGYGTRADNKELDPGMIVAYEISVVSDNQNEKVSGEFFIGNVRAYK